ncbi:hypothetical protein G7046_g9809 [Stylonectria norvegica]|nr:hypothetical protein G7046_g9809 [Stylonectria norvegica]
MEEDECGQDLRCRVLQREHKEFSKDKEKPRDHKEKKKPERCVICLERISDPCELLPCHHSNYDFSCILEWFEKSHKCPLCKATVSTVRYAVNGYFERTYDVSEVDHEPLGLNPVDGMPPGNPAESPPGNPAESPPGNPAESPLENPAESPPGNPAGRHPIDMWTLIRPHNNPPQRRPYPGRSNAHTSRIPQEVAHRRDIYRRNLRAKHVGSNKYNELTPLLFIADNTLMSRARMWIRRELMIFSFLTLDETDTMMPHPEVGPLVETNHPRSSRNVTLPSSFNRKLLGANPLKVVQHQRYNNAEHLLEYISLILRTVDIMEHTGKAEEILREYLGEDHANTFLHELRAFLRSGCSTLKKWDERVQYGDGTDAMSNITEVERNDVKRSRRRSDKSKSESKSESNSESKSEYKSNRNQDRHRRKRMMDWPFPSGDFTHEGGSIFDAEYRDVIHGQEPVDLDAVSESSATVGNEDDVVLAGADYRDLLQTPPCQSSATITEELIEDLDNVPLSEPQLDIEKTIHVKREEPATPIACSLISRSNTPEPPKSANLIVELPQSTLLTPRSCYDPFEPGVPVVGEREAVSRLLAAAKHAGQTDKFIEFQLDRFAVYQDNYKFPMEMRSLHQLDTKTGHGKLYLDGMLSVGELRLFVRRVLIAALPIDNYGTLSKHTVRDKIWLRSKLNANREIYYRLRTPVMEYRRFFKPFLWVADLAKHFVDFLKVMGENKRKVTIFHFRTTFTTWLKKVHKTAPAFTAWRIQHPSEDFRTSIVANLGFLHKEAVGVLGYSKTYSHTLWSEVWEYSCYKPFANKTPNPPTVVTQYVYDCFQHLPFGDRLEVVPLSKQTQALRNRLIRQRHLEMPSPIHDTNKDISQAASTTRRAIKPGDTISTHRDEEGSGTRWRRDVSHGFNDVDRWFALVQKIHSRPSGRTLDLFLSDHCSCAEASKIREDEVLGVHEVEFGGTSATTADFFCRQTYIHEERKWITLKKSHLHCEHTAQKVEVVPEYHPGDTLLVVLDRSTTRSEPCELVVSYREKGSDIFRFRRLLRRSEVDLHTTTARRNELVYSEHFVEVKKQQIKEPCFVRVFKPDQTIPSPYDRNGVGGFFFITHHQQRQQHLSDDGLPTYTHTYAPIDTSPPSLRQSYDPSVDTPKLRGLDLFCGGGNFGRGLEDGGGIAMQWANDYDSKAMHTYMANTSGPDAVAPFLGSIDDLQRQAMQGHFSRKVPRVGDVDFISGGSPCPGFSHLTNDKTTLAQRKNQSLVAAFGSFVDLYRPRYGLLENVPGIVQKRANRDQDVFSQLICAVVGLGYQTQFFFLDASSCGASQRRSRVFLAFAAPGYTLPKRPLQTHSHPPNTKAISLGNLPNGESMAERLMPEATPFKFVSGSEATADLPRIHDAKPDICVPFPDHRISLGITKQLRAKISLIPTRPWGSNFATAWYGPGTSTSAIRRPGSGTLTASERLVFPVDTGSSLSRTQRNSNAYGRQFPHRLIETVVTSQSPSDAKNGRMLHWEEDRVLTIMEARRAQGFRDDDVLLGSPPDQYRIVGNSVAREVAVALGCVFREAWVGSLRGEGGADAAGVAGVAAGVVGVAGVAGAGCVVDAAAAVPAVGDDDDVASAVAVAAASMILKEEFDESESQDDDSFRART